MKFGNGIGTVIYKIRRQKEIPKRTLASRTGLDIVLIDLIERNKKIDQS